MKNAEVLAACAYIDELVGDDPPSDNGKRLRTLAAWVREQVRSDDDEPVSEKWMRSIGWSPQEGGGQSYFHPNGEQGDIDAVRCGSGLFNFRMHNGYICPSRGAVRRLLAALGMEVRG
jgi:hypothetical protein